MGLFLISTIYIYELSLRETYKLPNGDVLIINPESSWEVTKSYTYEIKRKKIIVVPQTTFYYYFHNEKEPEFELIFSDDRKMVAVVTKNNPKKIFIIYDMQTKESIPHQGLNEQLEDYLSRKEKMMNLFNSGTHDYVLNNDS